MTTENEDSQETAGQDSTEKPDTGARLKALRERRGVALEEIAEATIIPVAKLRYLEDGQYDKLGSHTFAIGYIRKMAKYLGEEESDDLVNDYKTAVGEPVMPEAVPEVDESSTAPGGGTQDGLKVSTPAGGVTGVLSKLPGWGTIAGVALVLVVLAFWLKPGEPEPAPSEQASMSAPAELDEPAAGPSQEETELPAAQASEQVDTGLAGVGPVNTQERADTDDSLVGSEMPDEMAADVTEQNYARPENVAAPVAAQSVLVMTFSDDCWVEVQDAGGDVIFAAVQGPEDILRLEGEPPFSVMLGNARAATVAIDGRTVPSEPSPGRDTRRLTIAP